MWPVYVCYPASYKHSNRHPNHTEHVCVITDMNNSFIQAYACKDRMSWEYLFCRDCWRPAVLICFL